MNYKIYLILFLFAQLFLSCKKNNNIPIVKNGEINLKNWNFIQDGPINLRGKWKFKWLEDSLQYKEPGYKKNHWENIRVPSSWNYKTQKETGYACYGLEVIVDSGLDLAIQVERVETAYALYANGELILKNGKVGNTPEVTMPYKLPLFEKLPNSDTLKLTWYISNFHNVVYGGAICAPILGLESDVYFEYKRSLLFNAIILGIIFIISFYHLVFWGFRKKDKTNLYFFLCCSLFFLRMTAANNMLEHIFIDLNFYYFKVKIEVISITLATVLFPVFFRELYVDEFSKKILRIFVILGMICSVFVLLTPFRIYLKLIIFFEVILFFSSSWCIIGIVKATIRKRQGSRFILWGGIIFFLSAVNDLLYSNYVFDTVFLSHIGIVIFIVSQSVVISQNIAKAYTLSEHLSENLKEEVRHQTISIKNQKEALEKAYNKIKEMDTYKTMFFQNITHEFKTPLTLIINPLDSVIRKEFGEISKSVVIELKRVYNNATMLLKLINQLLDLAKFDAGKMKLALSKCDLIKLLKRTVSSFQSLAEKQGKELIIHCNIPELIIEIDQVKIEKVIYNLISNALKFTSENGRIELFVEKTTLDSSSAVEIKCKDNGIGIPRKDLPKIFNRFHQADNDITRSGQGTGVGLALISEYIKLHNGTITVKSDINKYTEFKIVIPYNKIFPSQSLPKLEAFENFFPRYSIDEKSTDFDNVDFQDETKGKSSSIKLLIVEDNVDMQAYLKRIFNNKYSLHITKNGQKGLEFAIDEIPDIIISDVMMPEMDGIDMLRQLKEDARTNHIPIILLTAKTEVEDKIKGIKFGAEAYVPKPFDKRFLEAKVNNILNQRKLLQQKYMKSILLKHENVVIHSAHEKFVNSAVAAIENNLDNVQFSITYLAQEMGLSQVQLYRKFKSILGKSPADFVMKIRLNHAAKNLEQSNLEDSIAEIAFRVGFKSIPHFNRRFKEEFSVSPGEYRKKFS